MNLEVQELGEALFNSLSVAEGRLQSISNMRLKLQVVLELHDNGDLADEVAVELFEHYRGVAEGLGFL
jgi:hypothetical protein